MVPQFNPGENDLHLGCEVKVCFVPQKLVRIESCWELKWDSQ